MRITSESSYHLRSPFNPLALVGFLLLFAHSGAQAQSSCDASYVTVDPTVITLQPTGTDDTANIQCALDTAVARGIPTVQFRTGAFRTGGIVANYFNGSLQGNTRTTTSITAIDGALDCNGMINAGRSPALFKMIGGSPRVRFMNVNYGNACGNGGQYYGIHFTGRSANDACKNDVIFGEVDRVDFFGPNSANGQDVIGVEASAEGYRLGGCNDTLSGTFKVNRSTFSNFNAAVITSMRAASPVDIRFNSFSNVNNGVWLRDSNQDTIVASNDFFLSGYNGGFSQGVFLETTVPNPPSTTSLKVNNNTFNRRLGDVAAYRSYQLTGPAEVNLVIVDNTFDFNGYVGNGFGILLADTNNGLVSNNTFLGDFGNAEIYLESPNQSEITSGWSITGNEFPGGGVIVFKERITNSVYGPGQAAELFDEGLNNFNLQ